MSKRTNCNHGEQRNSPWPYILSALAVIFCYIVFSLLLKTPQQMLRSGMLGGVGLCVLFFTLRGRPLHERFILAVIAAGIIMRIGYMLYTPFTLRGHDIGGWNEYGHYGYMYHLFAYGRLPDTNKMQFYHPPLQHIAQALVVKVFSLFQGETDLSALFEASKIVPCFASCAILWVSLRICRALDLSPGAAAMAMTVMAFHPAFYILSANVNNDSLMLLFFMTAILYTLRWYRRPTMENILMIALSIGLSMMTKISGFAVALFTGPVFLMVFVSRFRQGKERGLYRQFAAFAALCIPLGLWYPVRNLILFRQPFTYVLRFAQTTNLYCGDHSFVERFLSFPISQVFSPPFCNPTADCNLWIYNLKCSVFGEYWFSQKPFLTYSLLILNGLIILLSLGTMVYVLVRGKKLVPMTRYGFFALWLVQMALFIQFNIRYPFGCTMDFRYILPTIPAGAVYMGLALSQYREKSRLRRIVFCGGWALIGLFSAASVLFYTWGAG